ncbi:hypothetical protein JCM10213_000954 [Rhodosporidiobolus nylandii]
MALAVPASVSAASKALYRSLLRTALRMPDDHRRAFVVHRARSECDQSRFLQPGEVLDARMLEGEIYRDQLEHQAEHLTRLAAQQTLIPVDIRAPRPSPPAPAAASFSSGPAPPSSQGPSRPTRALGPSRPSRRPSATALPLPSSPPSPPPPPADRRKLLRALAARAENQRLGVGLKGRNRFMDGPEPSWIRRKREEQGKGDGREVNGHVHGDKCGCH